MTSVILNWRDIAEDYQDNILLGNGASIALSRQFQYEALLKKAREEGRIGEELSVLFDYFDTHNFELILTRLQHANAVNSALKIDDEHSKKINQAYDRVRQALIETVLENHPKHGDVASHLDRIYETLKKFKTIVSLNYDLLIYWALMPHLNTEDGYEIKDCFLNGKIECDFEWLRKPRKEAPESHCAILFYPHGNLLLARNEDGQEEKLKAKSGLLKDIFQKWEDKDCTPLFISEGTSSEKTNAIRSSEYLNTVYEQVLPKLEGSLVINGWSMQEADEHILKKITASKNIKKIALAIDKNKEAACLEKEQFLKKHFGSECDVVFFDRDSEGWWPNTNVALTNVA